MSNQDEVLSAGWTNYRLHQRPKPKPQAGASHAWSKRELNTTQCLLAEGYRAPAAGALVDTSVPTTVSWDTSCFAKSGGNLDLYLYALNKSSLLLPIHGWRSIPADKGKASLKLAPSWWIDDPHKSQNQSLYLNIVPSGNQPWDTANPTGPTWTAMYNAPAKGHSPPKDAISDPSASDKVISVFYASGGLTGAGKTAAIVCPLIVVFVIGALLVRKLHISRNNKTADFAEKIDNRMSRISIDWAAGGDGRGGAVPGSRPASFQSRPGSMFVPGAGHSGSHSLDQGLHNRAGVGSAAPSGWADGNPRNSQISFTPGARGSAYNPAVPSPLAGDRAHRASASTGGVGTGSGLKQAWYPPGPNRGNQDEDMEDLDDLAIMTAEEKMGARPLPPAETLEIEMPEGNHPLASGSRTHDSVITPSEAANPFELDRMSGHSPMAQQNPFEEAYADTSLAPASGEYDDGAMISPGPIDHMPTPGEDQGLLGQDTHSPAETAATDTKASPGKEATGKTIESDPHRTLFESEMAADDPWSADLDTRPVATHKPRASEAWTPAELPPSAAEPETTTEYTQTKTGDEENDFSAYQAAAAAGMTEDEAQPAGGHGRSTSVAQREAGGTHVRTTSAGPRTLIGAPRPQSGLSGQGSVGTSHVSNEDQVVGYNEAGYSDAYHGRI